MNVCNTHEVTDCPMCTVYVGEMGETSEGFDLDVGQALDSSGATWRTTQPDTDAPPTCQVRPTGQEWREPCGRPMPCAAHSDAPQEGRPTTPQTEAPICVCGKPLALSHISWDANYSPHTPEAAAGALPSVPLEEREDFKVGFHRGVRVGYLRGKRAAPPEASER
jgi:hypothetical protein